MRLSPILSCQDLCKSYGAKKVLHETAITVSGGEIVAVIGPNGAGKSTLFAMLAGVLAPDAGSIQLLASDVTAASLDRRARLGIAYVAQSASVFRRATVLQNLTMLVRTLRGKEQEYLAMAQQLAERFGLWELRNQSAQTLSEGERRRLEIARMQVLDVTSVDPKLVEHEAPF